MAAIRLPSFYPLHLGQGPFNIAPGAEAVDRSAEGHSSGAQAALSTTPTRPSGRGQQEIVITLLGFVTLAGIPTLKSSSWIWVVFLLAVAETAIQIDQPTMFMGS